MRPRGSKHTVHYYYHLKNPADLQLNYFIMMYDFVYRSLPACSIWRFSCPLLTIFMSFVLEDPWCLRGGPSTLCSALWWFSPSMFNEL